MKDSLKNTVAHFSFPLEILQEIRELRKRAGTSGRTHENFPSKDFTRRMFIRTTWDIRFQNV